MIKALDVIGLVMVQMGGDSSIRVEALGDRIVIELPSLREGIAIFRRLPGGGRGRRALIVPIHERLVDAGLGLEVRIGSAAIGRLGVGARSNLVGRLLGIAPMEIIPAGLLASRRGAGRPER